MKLDWLSTRFSFIVSELSFPLDVWPVSSTFDRLESPWSSISRAILDFWARLDFDSVCVDAAMFLSTWSTRLNSSKSNWTESSTNVPAGGLSISEFGPFEGFSTSKSFDWSFFFFSCNFLARLSCFIDFSSLLRVWVPSSVVAVAEVSEPAAGRTSSSPAEAAFFEHDPSSVPSEDDPPARWDADSPIRLSLNFSTDITSCLLLAASIGEGTFSGTFNALVTGGSALFGRFFDGGE